MSEERPGQFAHESRVYVWWSVPSSLHVALHFVPSGFTHETLPLGIITRTAYHTLETVENGVNPDACFVMLHYIESTQNVHITMLPVGNSDAREALDSQLKHGKTGFSNLLLQLHDAAASVSSPKPNGVYILYNSPDDLKTPSSSKVAIIHEMGTSDADVTSFFNTVMPGARRALLEA